MMLTLALLFAALPVATPPIQAVAPVQATATPVQDEPLSVPKIVYPPEAKTARIAGTVQLQISVDATGHVTDVKALSGPVALRQAAVDAYRQAAYKPILVSGRPAPALITSSVHFALNELPPDTDLLVQQNFQPFQAKCQQLSAVRDASALPTCRQALDAASHFITPTYDLEAHATAYNDVVLLLIADGKKSADLPEAGVLADQAVDLVNLTVKDNPHTPAVAVAYITRCEVRSLAANLKGAGQDCAVAEETLTTLLHDYPENDRAANYRVQLRETLQLHAIIADRDHHGSQAERLRSRALSL